MDGYKWNTALRGLLESNQPNKTLLAYSTSISKRGIKIDSHTLHLLFKACTLLPSITHVFPIAQELHCYTVKLGFHSNTILQTSLLVLYSLFGCLHSARQVFDETPQRDAVLWNALIAAHSQRKHPHEVISVARSMVLDSVRPTESTAVSLLSACSQLRALALGRSVHGYAFRNFIGFDIFVCNAVIDMYSKCGRLSTAYLFFGRMRSRNVVSWTAMINGYVESDLPYEAFALFKEMELARVAPDRATVLGVISMCSKLRRFEASEWIDDYVEKSGFQKSIRVGNALICMHGKCGDLERASRIFEGMAERSVVSWSSIIQGLAMHGHGTAALVRFVQMQREGFEPDEVVFVTVIGACSHAGLVAEGRECFRSMVEDYGLVPSMEHYGGMVDLFCRAGLVNEALGFMSRMPVTPDAAIWRVLAGSCRDEGDLSMARRVMHLLLDLEPEHSGNHVLKSSLEAMMGEWEDAEEVWKKMALRGVGKKDPGFSSVAVKQNVC
ncbi:uncharacterized protein M6B38_376655 [Iris pallida]|uniref:Pentatricopeptide repeat-containing protein n=1 Tax=Iris pallida TaxID=29817 RepID=A0AAX6GA30_IRIPA|nr:uncharacterized protein M6B38_376655 [Iris pallida]